MRTFALTEEEYAVLSTLGLLDDTEVDEVLAKVGGVIINKKLTGSDIIIGEWQNDYTYSNNNITSHNGSLYKSLQNSNLNKEPGVELAYWQNLNEILQMTTISDPAVNAAVTQSIVDSYSGVIITLTTTGNSQTITSPTNTSAGKRFTVVNNNTSTNSISVNGNTLEVGEGATFLWDGSFWIFVEISENLFELAGSDIRPITAGQNLDMRNAIIKGINNTRHNTAYTPTGTEPIGATYYDPDNHCLSTVYEYGAVLQHGFELYTFGSDEGNDYLEGTAVSVNGATGNRVIVQPTNASAASTNYEHYVGLLTTAPDSGNRFVAKEGVIHGINTTGSNFSETWNEGDIIYVSPTTPGNLTNIVPVAPNIKICVGTVIVKHATQGEIELLRRIFNKVIDSSDVYNETPSDNEIIQFNSSNNRFELTDTPEFQDINITGLTGQSVIKDTSVENTLENIDTGFIDIKEWTGITPEEKAKFTIDYNYSTRVLTLTKISDWFYYYKGRKVLVTGNITATAHSNAYGFYYYYFNDSTGVITISDTYFDVTSTAQLAVVLFNPTATDTIKGFAMDERHGAQMDGKTHEYNHLSSGSVYRSGGALAGYTLNTDTTAATTYSVASTVFADEDLDHTTTAQADGSNYTIMWRTAAGQWDWLTGQSLPYIISNNNITYNPSGSALVEVTTTNRYFNNYIVGTAAINTAFQNIILPSRVLYTSSTDTQAEDFNTYFPRSGFLAEFAPLYRICIFYNSGKSTTTGKSEICGVSNLRGLISITGGTPATDHLSLSNLNGGTYSDGGHSNLTQQTVSASSAPTVNDDITTHKEGSHWVKEDDNSIYHCVDNADGAAVWIGLNQDLKTTSSPTFASATISNAPTNSTDAVNKAYADGLVVGLIDDRGSYDASTNVFPSTGGSGTAGAILKGDLWYVSVAGTLGGVAVNVGDSFRALIDTPGQTASNWDVLESNIGYVPENTANKATTMTGNTGSNILFLTAKAIYDWATGLFQTLANIRTSFQVTPDDTHYPSEKLVKDSLDSKASLTGSENLTNKTLTAPIINVGSDANYDLYYRSSSGIFTRLAANTTTIKKALCMTGSGSAGNAPTWDTLVDFSTLNAPQGFLINGKIVTSVSSNNLTVAIKGLDGNDPSATNIVYVRIGNTVRSITAALSITLNAGTNYSNAGSAELATKEIDWFVYLTWTSSSELCLCFSRFPGARTQADFNMSANTHEKYAHYSANSGTSSTDEFELIGRFNATLSAGAGYTWSIPATSVIINRPIFETRWLSAVSTLAGFSSVANNTIRYKIIYNTIKISSTQLGGTSNATTFTFTAPFSMNANSILFNGIVNVQDNGTSQSNPGALEYTGGSNSIKVYKTWYAGAFTNSGNKICYLNTQEYEI